MAKKIGGGGGAKISGWLRRLQVNRLAIGQK